ncbi:serine/threonine-protein kinase [Actinomadura rudentiformis]|uniref:serine/threonine-protein kinase n=1 Tax=Actinomadura rudentiformis TaxID=359158 RepID=UPI00178C4705|nr:serine/threonine-protein kinase [Actinomadura rudentiformis]
MHRLAGPERVLAGRYRLVELVARGGTAEVWRATDLRLGRPVAVKIVEMPAQVWHEARHGARLVHPNVVEVLDVGDENGRLFMVMEWVAGSDLAVALRHGEVFSPRRVAEIGAQAARALEATHAQGIVHRDVKPGNLLLADNGTVKLADFGIAGTADRPRTRSGPLIGTSLYISPEQIRGQEAGPSSDLYALGCVLYELSAGRPPFVAPDTEELLRQHVEDDPIPLRTDGDLDQVIMSLLAKNPAQRPPSAGHVAHVLETLTLHQTTQVLPSSRPRSRARLSDRPLQAAAVAAVVLIAAVLTIVTVVETSAPATPAPAVTIPSKAPSSQAPSSHAPNSRAPSPPPGPAQLVPPAPDDQPPGHSKGKKKKDKKGRG